jgi:hypothetical protein
MSFLEKEKNLTAFNGNIIPNSYASTINYSKRFVAVM